MTYNHQEVESKWAKKWKDSNLFVCNFDDSDQKFYSLFMFPYPSAEGLHIGNYFCFTVSDLIAKFKRLQGYNAFCPIGWDAFGMHSENYAIKIGETPQKMLSRTVENFRNQMIESGFGVDFTKEVDTTSKEYYKWTQWIFLKLLEKDLAFQKSSLLNYCPSCKTVLADEQIENGGCERCKTQPEKKEMKQWFFKITEFGDRLLDGLSDMDWSDITKSAQKNWIGKSKGAEITVKVDGLDKELTYFTTRPDTTFGASFITVAPELKDVLDLVLPEFVMQAQEYIAVSGAKSDLDRISDNKEKTGDNKKDGEPNPTTIASNNKEEEELSPKEQALKILKILFSFVYYLCLFSILPLLPFIAISYYSFKRLKIFYNEEMGTL